MRPTTPRILLVSPHCDDVAWSVGGTVGMLSATSSATLVLVSVFSYATVTASGSSLRGLAPDVVAGCRLAEDERFATSLGLTHVTLGLPDAALRGYTRDTILGEPLPTDEGARLAARMLADLVAAEPFDVVCSPLALREHVDHVIVRDALREIVRPERLLHYEDQPYAAELGNQTEVAARVSAARHDLRPRHVDVTLHRDAKISAIRAYPSQLGRRDVVQQIMRYAAFSVGRTVERLWASTAHGASTAHDILDVAT